MTLELPAARFAPNAEATAYFVVAEALANAAKHSQAADVSVSATVEGDCLRVVVQDDGRGGAVIDRTRGSGLAGLEDRVAAAGGTIELRSPPGSGTRVTVMLPLDATVSPAPEAV